MNPRHNGPRSSPLSLTVANLALPASALIISPVLARTLGPDDRGSLAAYLAVTLLAPGLFGSGLQDALTSLGSASPRVDGLWQAGRWYAFRAATVATVITIAACFATAGRDPLLAALCGVYTGVMILFMPVRARFLCDGAFTRVATERWIQVICRSVGIVLLYHFDVLTVSSALFIQLLAITMGSTSLLCRSGRLPRRSAPHRTADGPAIAAVGRFTRNAALGSVGLVILLRLDQILIKPLSTASELGIYAIAVGIAEIPLAVSAALRSFIIPKVARERTTTCIGPLLLLTSAVGAMITVGILVFGREGIKILYGDGFQGAYGPMAVLSAAAITAMASDILNAALVGLGRPQSQSIAIAAAAAVTVVLLVVLIPAYGAMGAALATLASFLTGLGVAGTKVVRAQRRIRPSTLLEVSS